MCRRERHGRHHARNRAPPDGYTIICGHFGTFATNGAVYQLPYDLVTDFAPISLLPRNPYLIVGKKDLPANNLREFMAYVKDNPGKVNMGHPGVGTGPHLLALQLANTAGGTMNYVPYRGSGPAMIDLVAGQIDLMVDQVQTSSAHVKGGTIKAFAIAAPARSNSVPDVPTVDEAGAPGLHMSLWYGFWAPARHARADRAEAPGRGAGRARRSRGARPADQPRHGNPAARAADAGGADRAAEGRHRGLVADDQGRRHQDAMRGCDDDETFGAIHARRARRRPAATAQSYPSRPVTIIVPFAAGGATDVLTRFLAERMRTALGQTIVIENVTGAGGTIGVGRAARAPADGYTIQVGTSTTNMLSGGLYPLQFDLLTISIRSS